MAGNILVSPEELRSHGTDVTTRANAARDDFMSLKARLQALSGAFQGQAHDAFERHYEEWNTHATGLVDALDGLGKFLNTSADTIEQTDQQLAQGLG